MVLTLTISNLILVVLGQAADSLIILFLNFLETESQFPKNSSNKVRYTENFLFNNLESFYNRET